MAWKQLKDANWRVGYLGGWCEGYVSMAWGFSKFTYDRIGNVIGTQGNGKGKTNYPSATAHWKANLGNHPNQEPPLGITVPVFFSLGNVPEGHVAIRLDDGKVASSTQAGYHSQGYLHPNLKHLIDTYAPGNGGCKYLGWSEYVAGIQVVENTAQGGGSDMTYEQYAEHILDIIEDDPHYKANKKKAFDGHVAWLKAETPKDWAAPRKWAKGIMANNKVLNRTLMAKHLNDDAAYRTRVEAELDTLSRKEIEARVNLENAERAFTVERSEWNVEKAHIIDAHNREMEEIRHKLKDLEEENENCNTHLKKAQREAKDVSRWTWQEHLAAVIQKLFTRGGDA